MADSVHYLTREATGIFKLLDSGMVVIHSIIKVYNPPYQR